MLFRAGGVVLLLSFVGALCVSAQTPFLPKRLVICLDGVSWRDVRALQAGAAPDHRAKPLTAFNQGYYPVSRLVSSFPSCSDVAWTEMLGNRPLPGYQRTYFDVSANAAIYQNGISTTMEYESQMHWQVQGGWRRALGYAAPVLEFKHDVRQLIDSFLHHSSGIATYYAMLRTTDDAQHLSGNISRMLQFLDERLIELQTTYR